VSPPPRRDPQKFALLRRALVQAAQAQGRSFVWAQGQYVREQFLLRLRLALPKQTLTLKGATLLPVWLGPQARRTETLNLQQTDALGAIDPAALRKLTAQICEADADLPQRLDDCLYFVGTSVQLQPQRLASGYATTAVSLRVELGGRPSVFMFDVCANRTPTLRSVLVQLPASLVPHAQAGAQLPTCAPLQGATAEHFAAEKLHCLNSASAPGAEPFSRPQDLWDLYCLVEAEKLERAALKAALHTVFERRQSAPLRAVPDLLQADSAHYPLLEATWRHYVRQQKFVAPPDCAAVMQRLAVYLTDLPV
jgi:hypothetical protein